MHTHEFTEYQMIINDKCFLGIEKDIISKIFLIEMGCGLDFEGYGAFLFQ